MTRLHFKEIAPSQNKLPRTSACSVSEVVLLWSLLLLVGLRSALLRPRDLARWDHCKHWLFLAIKYKEVEQTNIPFVALGKYLRNFPSWYSKQANLRGVCEQHHTKYKHWPVPSNFSFRKPEARLGGITEICRSRNRDP